MDIFKWIPVPLDNNINNNNNFTESAPPTPTNQNFASNFMFEDFNDIEEKNPISSSINFSSLDQEKK